MKELTVNLTKEVEETMKSIKTLKSGKKVYDLGVVMPKGLKVNMQANKELNNLVNKYYLVSFELAHHKIALQKTNAILIESIDKLQALVNEGKADDRQRTQLTNDMRLLAINKGRFEVYNYAQKSIVAECTNEVSGLYDYYYADLQVGDYGFTSLNRALEQWFLQYDIQYTKPLKTFLMAVVGTVSKAKAKAIVQNQFIQKVNQKAFLDTLLSALTQIAIFKNAISLRTISEITETTFDEFKDMDYQVVEERPTTIAEYKAFFDEVGVTCTGCSSKEEYEKLFDKSCNRLFVWVG